MAPWGFATTRLPAARTTMHRQSIVLATLCALGGAGVAALLIDRDTRSDVARVSELQRRLDVLEGKVATPALPERTPVAPVARPSDKQALPPGVGESAQAPAVATPDEANSLPFADAAADAERRRYETGVFEQALAAEPVDVSASNTFAQGLTQAFGGAPELAGNQLLDAQCRVSLCRIAVLHRSDDDMEAFLGNVGSLPGLGNTDTYWQRELNADGSSVMTMYVARNGHALPDYQVQAPGSFAKRSGGS